MRVLAILLLPIASTTGLVARQEVRWDGRVPEFLVVDVAGDGVCLTSKATGVMLDFTGRGVQKLTPWTCAHQEDAFLVIDRNGNGLVDGASEMVGGLLGPPNGFEYLRIRAAPRRSLLPQAPAWLDVHQRPFSELALWTDRDHNGRSEWRELQSLDYAGVRRIELTGRGDAKRDGWGNLVLARSRVQFVRNNSTQLTFLVSVRLSGQVP